MKNKNRQVRKLPFPRTCSECKTLFDSIEFSSDGAKVRMYDRQFCLQCRPPAYNKQNYCDVERLSKEEFIDLISTSRTYQEVAKKMGKARAFNKIRLQIIRRMEKIPGLKLMPYERVTYTNEEIFTKNSPVTWAWAKRKILEHNLKEYKCEKCNNEGYWNGKSLTLQLDHINGDNKDNRLENLRFLCPSCHSQTLTFSGRNCNE